MQISKVAVLGSGVMGSGIAALCANAGLEVILMDIVPEGAADRHALAKGAIEKQLKGGGARVYACGQRQAREACEF